MGLRTWRIYPMLIGFVAGAIIGFLPFLFSKMGLGALAYVIRLPGAYITFLVYNLFAGTEGSVQAEGGFVWTIVSIPLVYGLTGCLIGYVVSRFTR